MYCHCIIVLPPPAVEVTLAEQRDLSSANSRASRAPFAENVKASLAKPEALKRSGKHAKYEAKLIYDRRHCAASGTRRILIIVPSCSAAFALFCAELANKTADLSGQTLAIIVGGCFYIFLPYFSK